MSRYMPAKTEANIDFPYRNIPVNQSQFGDGCNAWGECAMAEWHTSQTARRACCLWGEMLKSGMIVDENETHIECSYWLALIEGPAHPVPESQVHASDQSEEGWLVVKARWFELVTESPRCYKLAGEERLLVVNVTE